MKNATRWIAIIKKKRREITNNKKDSTLLFMQHQNITRTTFDKKLVSFLCTTLLISNVLFFPGNALARCDNDEDDYHHGNGKDIVIISGINGTYVNGSLVGISSSSNSSAGVSGTGRPLATGTTSISPILQGPEGPEPLPSMHPYPSSSSQSSTSSSFSMQVPSTTVTRTSTSILPASATADSPLPEPANNPELDQGVASRYVTSHAIDRRVCFVLTRSIFIEKLC